MLVVSDLEDLFLPLPEDILVNLADSEAAILNLLDSFPSIFRETKAAEGGASPHSRCAAIEGNARAKR